MFFFFQGAHFFQNVMSFGIAYLTIDSREGMTEESIDYEWLHSQKKVAIFCASQPF